MGRHAAFLDDLIAQKIVAAVKAGASRTGAAKVAKVGRSTLLSWLAKGREGEQPYADFLDRVREAEGDLEKKLVGYAFGIASDPSHKDAAKMIEMLLTLRCSWGKVGENAKAAEANANRDQALDLDIARSVVAALESRKAG